MHTRERKASLHMKRIAHATQQQKRIQRTKTDREGTENTYAQTKKEHISGEKEREPENREAVWRCVTRTKEVSEREGEQRRGILAEDTGKHTHPKEYIRRSPREGGRKGDAINNSLLCFFLQ